MDVLIMSLAAAPLVLAGMATQIALAAEPVPQEFDLNGCYSTCPCVTNMTHA